MGIFSPSSLLGCPPLGGAASRICEFNFQVHLSWCVKKQRSTSIFPLPIHLPHVEERMKEYSQLTQSQRYEISALHKAGHGPRRIAEVVGVHRTTISRELEMQ